MLNKEVSDSSPARQSSLLSVKDLGTSLFKRGCCGGGVIFVVDMCPRAPPLRRRLLQRRHGAWEVVEERMQIAERVLGSWFMDRRYGFLLRRHNHVGVPDLEFDGVSGVLPRSDSFNGNGFAFGEPLWRSAKLHMSDGAASSLCVVVNCHFFLWWLLWW